MSSGGGGLPLLSPYTSLMLLHFLTGQAEACPV